MCSNSILELEIPSSSLLKSSIHSKSVNLGAMEQFLLSAQHSGSISHAHTFQLPQSAAELAREVRITVAIVAVAWVAVTAIKQFGWRNQGTR
ncbi:hypothetical protein HDV63DRAFT_390874 [Trichoderma sp. SZMC 28014]